MSQKKTRLPFDKRVKEAPGMRLTERDVEIVAACYQYRFLLRDQIERLFFKSRNPANYRLQRLFQHGFLNRIYLPSDMRYNARNTQAMYCLDEKGAELLAREWDVAREDIHWYPDRNRVGEEFIEHQLKLNDLQIAIRKAAEARGDKITTWVPDWELKAQNDFVEDPQTDKRYPVIPDAYFVYELTETGQKAHFFVELDRATMENRRFAVKIKAYIEYGKSGRFTKRYGAKSFRVLTVVPSARRLKNLKATTEAQGGEGRFWFTTFASMTPELILGEVWQIAKREGLASIIGRPKPEANSAESL